MSMWLKRLFLITIFCLFTSNIYAAFPPVKWREIDNSPSLYPTEVIVPNNGIETTTGSIVELDFSSIGHNAVTVTDSATIDFTLTTQDITGVVKTDSINDTYVDWGTGANQVNPADFANQDIGDITITTGDWAVEDDSHAHGTTTLSGIDISADTNLAVTAPVVLTDDTLSLTVAKDIVAGVGLSGGEDNVLPGADADTTLTLDLTEVSSLTWGAGAFTTMTFDAGVTDPVITASSGDLAVSTGTFTLLNTGLHLLDTNATHDLIIKPGSDITADRTLTLTTGDADRTITINGDTTISGTNTGDNTVATTGDSATSFFSTGTLEVAIGGTGTTTSTGTGSVVLSASPAFTGTTTAVSVDASNTVTGITVVATTNMTLPNSTSPSIGGSGKIGIDTTDDQLLYYGGALRTLPYTYEQCFTLENPVAADDNVPIWSPLDAVTITSQYCRTQGGTSCGVIISDGTNDMESITCDGDGQADDGTLTNNTFTANERVEFDIGTVSGTVTWINMCLRYTIDRQ